MTDRQRFHDRVVQSLRSAVTDGQMGLDDVPALVKRVLCERMWRSRVVEQTGQPICFGDFLSFVNAKPPEGLGTSSQMLQRLCSDDPEALDLIDRTIHDERHNTKVYRPSGERDNVIARRSQGGNSRECAMRRLRKDRPDLHAEVLNGKMTFNRAMVVAGFRRQTLIIPAEPTAAAQAIIRRFKECDLRQFVDELEKLRSDLQIR